MQTVDEDELALRVAIRTYAARLRRLFAHMGTLSGTGVRTPRRRHMPVQIQPGEPNEQRDRHYRNGPGETEAEAGVHRAGATAGPVDEVEFLGRWAAAPVPGPLLLLAPFGGGKSVVLETFALGQAKSLLENGASGVPLPVRLRDWNWHERESMSDYLYRSQLVLDSDREGILSQDQIGLLLRAGRLIPLFDGFDELPGEYDSPDGRSLRDAALASVQSLCQPEGGPPCRFIVTSRPGYDIEHSDLFDPEHRHFLREYEREEIVDYVRNQFGAANAKTDDKDDAENNEDDSPASRALRSVDPDLAELLSRPLFLATWCAEARRNPSDPPTSIKQILSCIALRAFDVQRIRHRLGRHASQDLRSRQGQITPEHLLRQIPTFGALLFPFADAHFPRELAAEEASEQFRGLVPGLDERETEWARFLCEGAGLIVRTSPATVYAIKIPLTEFLVGEHLARLAAQGDAARRRFIATFRRWAWCPDLHDALRFAFASMRHGTARQQEIAEACVAWLLNIAEGCPLARSVAGPPDRPGGEARDDLLRPFSILAANLGGANERATQLLVRSRWRANRLHPEADIPIMRRIPPSAILPYAAGAISQFELGNQRLTPLNFVGLCHEASERLPACDAYQFLSLLFQAAADGKPIERGYFPFRAIGAKLAPRDAAEAIRAWLTGLRESDADGQGPSPGKPGSADEVAQKGTFSELIRRWQSVSKVAGAVWAFAEGTASRVTPQEARGVTEEIVKKAGLMVSGFRLFRFAIRHAASRVPAERAASTANAWIQRHIETDSGHRGEWSPAVFAVARRIPAASVPDLVREWECGVTELRRDDQCIWLCALAGVVRHVGETKAQEILDRLLSAELRDDFDPFDDSLILGTFHAAQCIPASLAAQYTDNLLRNLRDRGIYDRYRRSVALWGVTRKLSVEQLGTTIPNLRGLLPQLALQRYSRFAAAPCRDRFAAAFRRWW